MKIVFEFTKEELEKTEVSKEDMPFFIRDIIDAKEFYLEDYELEVKVTDEG